MTTAYQRVADALREEIQSGRWRAGERLPGELEIMRDFNVSRNTVRQALSQLENGNYVRRHQGRGTFVAEQGVSHVLGNLMSFTETLRSLGKEPGIDRVSVGVDENPPSDASTFIPGTRIWLVERLRTADGRPFCRMQSWLPDALGATITPALMRKHQSLYAILASGFDHKPGSATEVIRSESASPSDAEMLDVAVGTPLLTTYRWTSDHRGQPVEFVRSASPGDRYQYVVKLSQ